MSKEEQELATELEEILGRVSEIKGHIDQILQKEREDKRVAWRTRIAVLLGVTTSL